MSENPPELQPAAEVPASPEAPAEPAEPAEPAATAEPTPQPSLEKPRRRKGPIIATVLLSVFLLLALGAGGWLYWQLSEANAQIEQQQQELDEREELIDQKEVFGAAMLRISNSIAQLDGLPFATLVHWPLYDSLAVQGYSHRWHADALGYDILGAERAASELEEVVAAATTEAASNGTGSVWEATLDQLGRGYVSTVIEDADAFCEEDVLACVDFGEPFTVHVDAASSGEPQMTDWLRTGAAYHEFAHVLQATNPEPTEETLAVFGGDEERMADCYSLAFLEGWTLEHEVWINSYEYWEVEIGYGYTCNDAERQAIRDWNAKLGVTAREIAA